MQIIFCNIGAHNRWRHIENQMKSRLTQDVGVHNNLKFITFCEMYFYKGGRQMNSKWCGIVHDPPETGKFNSGRSIFNNQMFNRSLNHCICLFAMDTNSCEWIKKNLERLGKSNIQVFRLYHPLPLIETPLQFDIEKYLNNKEKQLIQIGYWLRKPYAIFDVSAPANYSKSICPWDNRQQQNMKKYVARDKYQLIADLSNNVKKITRFNSTEYAQVFESSIVFLELYASTVNNVILECIYGNTPIVVNKLTPITEYLGEDYPLYFTDRKNVSKLLSDEKIKEAHQYLTNMNKDKLSIDFFIDSIKEHLKKCL